MERYLAHHGIKGQHWGERNGPPYPLSQVSTDISIHNYNRINDLYKSMPLHDRRMIDPDTPENPTNYFSSKDNYKKSTAYNAVSDNGFIVAERIPKSGIGVKTKNQGFGTNMVSDLVKWFDDQDEFDTMWWPVDKSNKASIRVAEKNGFRKDPLGDNYIYAKDSAYKKLGISNFITDSQN